MKTFPFRTISKRMLADTITPVSIFLKIRDIYPNSILLESSDYHGNENSYSFICLNPVATFIMLLVSAPFVIGIHRGISVGARIMLGVTIGMAFNIFDKIVNHMGLIYNLNPLFMALLPSVMVLLIVMYAMQKSKI